MDAESPKSLPAFGFLTILEDASHGVFGGYLVTTHHGRPLEFRCSTPVFPSRAQQILYGASLRPYLLGELIGKGLVESAQTLVAAILTDQPDMLGTALHRPEEFIYVDPTDDAAMSDRSASTCDVAVLGDASEASRSPHGFRLGERFATGRRRLYLAPTSLSRPEKVELLIAPLLVEVDPLEPFQRIRGALVEAGQLAGDVGGGADEHAAAA